MKLTLHGHEELYSVEQLMMSLFPVGAEGQAVSTLSRGKVWLTATTVITYEGKTVRATKRLKAEDESVRTRRQIYSRAFT